MFLKKGKIFLGKNILRFVKQPNGSIAIIVLIIGIAIVLAVGALSAYMIKDIKFTQIDEQKLKALNIAEAGISNMYFNLDKFYNNNLNGYKLPGVSDDGIVYKYHDDLKDGTEVLGTYYVEYAPYYINSIFSGYIINSKGVEKKSQTARKVGVKIKIVPPSSSFNIFDYLYSTSTVTYNGNDRIIDGPFYTKGNIELLGNSGFQQNYSTGSIIAEGKIVMNGNSFINDGPVYAKQDVYMTANSTIKKGTVSFAGNLIMDGNSKIDFNLESPMIVMGNITMGGNSIIGESGKNLDLSCPGIITKKANAKIYYTLPIGSQTFTFNDPSFDLVTLIDEYKNDVLSSALKINGDLLIKKNNYFNYSSGTNSISFQKIGTQYRLNIKGNVIVTGNIYLGNHEDAFFNQYIIYYEGKGTLYSTGNIDVYAEVKPLNMAYFPNDCLLTLISEGNIHLIVEKAFFTSGSYENPHIALVAIAKGNLISDIGIVTRGSLLAGSLQADTQFNKIYYQDGIKDALPTDIPQQSSGGSANTTFTQVQWQELTP